MSRLRTRIAERMVEVVAAVTIDDRNYGTARSLIDLLATLLPIDAGVVPPTSLLREFVGGSGFQY